MKRQAWIALLPIAAVVFGLIIVLIGGGVLFSFIAEEPDCVFPHGGGTCEYSLELPEGRSASIYALDLEFGSSPAVVYTDLKTLTSIDFRRAYEENRDRDEKDTYEIYLFRVPSGPEAESIKISATMSARAACTSGEYGDAGLYVYGITIPYPPNTIEYATRDDSRYHDEFDLYEQHSETRDGDETHSWKKATSLGSVEITDCKPGEDQNGVKTLTVEWKNLPPHNDTSELAFLVVGDEADEGGAYVLTQEPTDVEVSFARAVYPSDVSYGIGNTKIETFTGVQQDPVRTLDFAESVNRDCGRDRDAGACTVSVVFESSTAGTLFVSEERTLRLADPDVGIEPEEPVSEPSEPVEEPSNPTQEPSEEPGQTSDPVEKNWFVRFIESFGFWLQRLFA